MDEPRTMKQETSTRPLSRRGSQEHLGVGGMVDLHGRRRVVAAVVAIVVLAALVMWAKAAERPPAPVPASAPKTEFSAERVGTPAADRR